ncbi:flagellar biosynthesis anti-sigma factor FlgM [Variovorax sp. W6]|uniref:flagellar biosynthesis anti-sigma factor FlgM n=1 Tax=Variovorax sp. W6 TaxID=3093895 RepID=UPI003D8050A4
MKIDQPAPSATPLHRTTPATAGTAGTAAATGADAAQRAARAAAPAPSAHVHTLPSAAGTASDFDAARVAAIREDIRAGRYQIRPERIADGLLASVRDLLTPGAPGTPGTPGAPGEKGDGE